MKNLKKLIEKREDLVNHLDGIRAKADEEIRAMTEEEIAEFERIENEVRAIDQTIEIENRSREAMKKETKASDHVELEERAFADYVMGKVSELRSGGQNVTMTNNGAIIPTSIANRIIKTVKDRCPILAGATIYNVKGNLKVPVWTANAIDHDIAVGYQSEFIDITADSGKFTSIDLGGYLAGALVLIGRSVENNGSFSVVDFIVNQMADSIAMWIESQLLTGTGSSAAQGALNTANTKVTAAAAEITVDELIELQAKVKQAYQANACWTMNPATFTEIKKLKDGNGRYLLQDDVTGAFPYRLLGKPVYLSDNMPRIAASAKTVLYGDYSGLSVNFRENISIEVLREKYATQHAIGVVSWFEFDSKVTDIQRLAVLIQAAS